jgi:transposase
VYKLDGQLGSINLDIAVHTRGYKTKANDLDLRLIQLTKLQNDLEKKKQIVIRLEGLINTSKEQQRRIFAEHKKNRYKTSRNSADNDKYIISTTDY